MRRRAWVLGVGVVTGWLVVQPCAGAVILINEVLADPPALIGDANRDGTASTTQDEFVELANTGADPVSLAGWTLADDLKTRHLFAADTLIPGFGLFVLFSGGAPAGFAHAATASTGSLGLNNTGDTVFLRDAAAVLIDALVYGPEGGQDTSLTRAPDAVGPFTSHLALNGIRFSPGTTADGRAQLPAPVDIPTPPSPGADPMVPEPASFLLVGLGLLGSVLTRRP